MLSYPHLMSKAEGRRYVAGTTLTMDGYRPRLIEGRLDALLEAFGCVEVVGPKWCGKTWTALSRAASVTRLDGARERQAAEVDPSLALIGDAPHLVDEWQEVPEVWDAARRFVDDCGGRRGLLILTGSTSLSKARRRLVRHSGAGRIARLEMRPFSLREAGWATGNVSLSALFAGKGLEPQRGETSVRDVARWCCRGGWPASAELDYDASLEVPAQYIRAALDVNVVEEGLSPEYAESLMKALAFNASRSVTYETLLSDMAAYGAAPGCVDTMVSYLDVLRRLYLVEELPGWAPPMRAKERVRVRPKRYFVDPSLAAALLGASEGGLLRDTQTLGDLFENLCLRELRICLSTYAGLGNQVSYYRDEKGLEVDFIVEHAGAWAGIEAKLSDAKIDQAAKNLVRLKDKVSGNPAARNAEPAFLAVLVGAGTMAYRRPDGVYVIPVAMLAP